MAQGGQIQGAQIIAYTARAYDEAGRIYAATEGAQRLPRTLRLLLFGSTHVELDIAGAFYEIVRRRILADFPGGACLPPIGEFRLRIQQALPLHIKEREVLIKRLTSIAINLSADRFRAWTRINGLSPWIDKLMPLFSELQMQANAATQTYATTIRAGTFGSRERTFRVLECMEMALTLRLVDLLTTHSILHSLVWLHDGIWISPVPSEELINSIDRQICQEFNLQASSTLFRVKSLQDSYKAVVSALPRQRTKLPDQQSKHKLWPTNATVTISRNFSRDTRTAAERFYERMDHKHRHA